MKILRLLCGCAKEVTDESFPHAKATKERVAVVADSRHAKTDPSGAKSLRVELSENVDESIGAQIGGLAESSSVACSHQLAKRRSSSNVDALATLAENEALGPLIEGSPQVAEGTARAVLWNVQDGCRSSCPAAGAYGTASGLEPYNGTSSHLRAYSLASASRNGYCASPVSTATARSVASPMRHDFMTLLRQASNRGSSSGIMPETLPAPPHPWSPSILADPCGRAGATAVGRVDWAGAQQVQMNMAPPTNASRSRRQRRASAFAASDCEKPDRCSVRHVAAGGATAEGNAVACGVRPSCIAPVTFSRCSSSPDIRPGGFLMAKACAATAAASQTHAAEHAEDRPPLPLHGGGAPYPVSSGSGGTGFGCGGGTGSSGSSQVWAGRGCQYGASSFAHPSSRSCDMRTVPPSHSPLRPRELPSRTAGQGSPAPLRPSAGTVADSGSQMSPARLSAAGSARCSYQHGRLLQQLREQHGRQGARLSGAGGPASPRASWEATASTWVAAGAPGDPNSSSAILPTLRENARGVQIGDCGNMNKDSVGDDNVGDVLVCTLPIANRLAAISPVRLDAARARGLGGRSVGAGAGIPAGGGNVGAEEKQTSAQPQDATQRPIDSGSSEGGADGPSVVCVSFVATVGTPAVPAAVPNVLGLGGDAAQPSSHAALVEDVRETAELFSGSRVGRPTGPSTEGTSHTVWSPAAGDAMRALEQLLERNVLPDSPAPPLLQPSQPQPTPGQGPLKALCGDVTGQLPGSSVWTGGCHVVCAGAGLDVFGADSGRRERAVSTSWGPHADTQSVPAQEVNISVSSDHIRTVDEARVPGLAVPCGAHAAVPVMRPQSTAAAAQPSPQAGTLRSGASDSTAANSAVPPFLTSAEPVLLTAQDASSSLLGFPVCPSSRASDGGIGGELSLHNNNFGTAHGTVAVALPGDGRAAPASGALARGVPASSTPLLPSPLPRFAGVVANIYSSSCANGLLETQSAITPDGFARASADVSLRSLSVQSRCSTDRTSGCSGRGQDRGDDLIPEAAAVQAHLRSSLTSVPEHTAPANDTEGAAAAAAAAAVAYAGALAGCTGGSASASASAVLSMRRGTTGSIGARGSSLIASETSLTAIALLRSAAAVVVLPDDAPPGSTVALGSALGLDGTDSVVQYGSAAVGDNGGGGGSAGVAGPDGAVVELVACVGDLPPSPFNTANWDADGSQPAMSSASARRMGPRIALSTAPGSPAIPLAPSPALPATCGLRLEDGLVSDPLMLLDGLGSLTYITSGAYAAVYKGSWEDQPVGIKFLASASLDLNSPAVKEALLGPGWEHENIIRTFTTRVARVDPRAVAQLKAVAAAMAATAAAPAFRSRNSTPANNRNSGSSNSNNNSRTSGRRCASAAYQAGFPASVAAPATHSATVSPPGPSPQQHHHHHQQLLLLQEQGTPPQPPAAAGGSAAPRPTHRRASTAGSPARSWTGTPGHACEQGIGDLAAGTVSPRTPVQDATPLTTSVRSVSEHCGESVSISSGPGAGPNGTAPAPPRTPCPGSACPPSPHATGLGNVVDSPEVASAAVVDRAGGGNVQAGWLNSRLSRGRDEQQQQRGDVPTAARLIFMRRSASANARGTMSVSTGDVPAHIPYGGPGSVVQSAEPAALTPRPAMRPPPRRGSAQALPRVSLAAVQPPPTAQRQSHGGMLTAGGGGGIASAGANAGVRSVGATPPRRSAAECLLDVLRALQVVGPTGQGTSTPQYVTAVVMELADAGNLDSFSRAQPLCGMATAVDLLRQVASGMTYLHAHGLVHGDLKPANVLLSQDPVTKRLVAKVADFGLSGLSGQQGSSGGADTCGTIAYSAPERLGEEGVAEQAADVYSFGICMQQLVSGERPFADLTFGQILFGVLCQGMRPEWPKDRCGALEPLYNMCCDAVPARRPTFEQVITWLDTHVP